MALVTATGMAVAIRHDTRAVAILASLGGFLTPILLGGDTDAAGVLFTYLFVLDAGLLAAAVWRGWRELPLLALAGTQLLYWGWLGEWYRPARLVPALVAASVFYALFAAVGRRGTALLVLAAPTAYFLATRRILTPDHTAWLALLCLVLATGYFLAGRRALRLAGEGATGVVLHLALAVAFLTLAFAVHLSRYTLALVWGVEGAVLLWGGLRLETRRLRLGALVVLGLGWGRWLTLVTDRSWHDGAFLVAHPAFPAALVLGAASALAAGLYRRAGLEARGGERLAYPGLVLAACGGPALLVSVEVLQILGPRLPLAYVGVLTTVVWTLVALPLLALARGDRTRILLAVATLLLVAVGLVAVGPDARAWRSLRPELRLVGLNLRFLSGLLIVVLYGLYARVVPELPVVSRRTAARLGAIAASAAAVLLLWNLSAEVALAPIDGLGRVDADKLRSAALSVLWTLYAFAAMGVGMWRDRAALRIGAIGLFGLTVAKVLLVDLSGLDTGYRVLSFLVLGAVLMLASFVYTRYRRRSVAGEAP
jgi:uncharacterized membrane protein